MRYTISTGDSNLLEYTNHTDQKGLI